MTNPQSIAEFKQSLERIINANNMEDSSNTPDWVLAKYLYNCLQSFEFATNERDKWYGIAPIPSNPQRRQ